MTSEVNQIRELANKIKYEMRKVIVGQDKVLEEILVALLAEGHVLIEGVPGIAKTVMVKTLAMIIQGEFKRIQFTPDLMPSDIMGTSVFDMKTGSFYVKKGPVFTNLLLADEINRTPPKTQSALLEAMEERQATIDGTPHPLPPLFMVFATQNPIEYEGTYPLPEAQLDRFMLKILIHYPAWEEEKEILSRYHRGFDAHRLSEVGLQPVANYEQIQTCRKAVQSIIVSEGIFDYVMRIIKNTRESINITLGGSPRAAIHLLLTSKALAAINGRTYVIPDDVKRMAYPVLRHRLILRPEVEIEGLTADDIISNILGTIEVPR